ncbi:hypothetical protein EYF80_016131 [Liparis tanakae]|uniref:Uncharacterized protein n=1 Tax=Liparis tanakae TaxID=230148 RepID=A0A4Z2I669_9TELE|nr:hypothetical protein EYF80_016131 [Liparis tanakae]
MKYAGADSGASSITSPTCLWQPVTLPAAVCLSGLGVSSTQPAGRPVPSVVRLGRTRCTPVSVSSVDMRRQDGLGNNTEDNIFMKLKDTAAGSKVEARMWRLLLLLLLPTPFALNIPDVAALVLSFRETGQSPELKDSEEASVCSEFINAEQLETIRYYNIEEHRFLLKNHRDLWPTQPTREKLQGQDETNSWKDDCGSAKVDSWTVLENHWGLDEQLSIFREFNMDLGESKGLPGGRKTDLMRPLFLERQAT